MHFVAVEQRVRTVRGQLHKDRVIIEVVPVKIFREPVRHIYAEPVSSVAAPEPDSFYKILMDIGVIPVPVRLLLGKKMQVPLPVRYTGPCRASKMGLPAGGRQLPMVASAVTENISVPLLRSGRGLEGFYEPWMAVG